MVSGVGRYINPKDSLTVALSEAGLQYERARPQSRAGGVSTSSGDPIIIRCHSAKEIMHARQLLSTEYPSLRVRDIGGGRGGNNQSFSISKLWSATDVFIQFVAEPTVKITTASRELGDVSTPEAEDAYEDESADEDGPASPISTGRASPQGEVAEVGAADMGDEPIVTISPNITLQELNQKLAEMGLHSDGLSGCLPFMSFAGGLGTQSHSSQQYLADMVQAVTVVLPNGKEKTYQSGDDDFNLICKGPNLGLVGTIVSIDIKVNKGKRQLKKDIALSTFEDFTSPAQLDTWKEEGLHSRTIMMQGAGLEESSYVKTTHLTYVDEKASRSDGDTTPDTYTYGSQRSEGWVIWFANTFPALFRFFFIASVMDERHRSRQEVAEVADIMGPESILYAGVTEAGLIFKFTSSEEVSAFFTHMQSTLNDYEAKGLIPVNTAVFVRFPKSLGEEGNDVCVDFASMGLDLALMKPFIDDLFKFFAEDKKERMKPHAHWGKTGAIRFNKQHNSKFWEAHKSSLKIFYDSNGLNAKALEDNIRRLEQPARVEAFLAGIDEKIKKGTTINDIDYTDLLTRIKARVKIQFRDAPGIEKIDFLLDIADKLIALEKTVDTSKALTELRTYIQTNRHEDKHNQFRDNRLSFFRGDDAKPETVRISDDCLALIERSLGSFSPRLP